MKTVTVIAKLFVPTVALALAAGCAKRGEIDPTGGITAIRTACPTVAIPAGLGDITLFDPATSRDAAALDVTATMTNVRSTCTDAGADVQTAISFQIDAVRTRAEGARDVSVPYLLAVVRGGNAVVAKRTGVVALHFAPGAARATATGQATSLVNRAAATLPKDIRKTLTEKRKAGDEDAAVDPLTRPEVRDAVAKASFEALVGFQLTDEQLRYNAQR